MVAHVGGHITEAGSSTIKGEKMANQALFLIDSQNV